MSETAASWSTQQLGEFVAVTSDAPDLATALADAADHAADALSADAVAVVLAGTVARSVGWPRGEVPEEVAMRAIDAMLTSVPIAGLGEVPAVSARLGDDPYSVLLVARTDPLSPSESSLLRAMARTLGLAISNHLMLAELRERQVLLEGLGEIQRAIAQHMPLDEVLQAIVALAHRLLSDEHTAIVLLDPDDPSMMQSVASAGYPEALDPLVRRRRSDEGVAGAAIREGRLIVADDYASSEHRVPSWVDAGMQRAMAAPVFEHGNVVGALLVTAFREPTNAYTEADRSTLTAIAEHVGLALQDAQTLKEMLHQALHDALTGLPNRVLFGDRLEHALERAERAGADVAVLFVDLDRFKTVNDSLGHAAGDELLCAVSERIRACLRGADTAARLGGDEFAVLLEDLRSPQEAEEVAERIIDALRAPVLLEGREVFAGASIGLATGRRGDELLRQADVAMYRAKGAGKGRVVRYHASMQAEALERLELESDLRGAVERGEFELHYQPILVLASGELGGVEALLRWRHPTRGLVAPLAFVPVAEDIGLIGAIGRHVLTTACRQAVAWREAGAAPGLLLAVNLSGRQLEDPSFPDTVCEVLRETGISPGALLLEITETVLMGDTEATIERLAAIRALGVRLAVDDFGTGYSSLRYLNRFPVDVLKMAKPFVDRIDSDTEQRALARSIVDLGGNLGLQIIAEGIERSDQLAQLRMLGCEMGQGFHFGVPASPEEIGPIVLGGFEPPAGATFP